MSWRSVVALALVAAALGAYVGLIDPPLRSSGGHDPAGRSVLGGLTMDRVYRIRIAGDSTAAVLVRGPTTWRLLEPVEAPADEAAVRKLLSTLEFATVTRTLSEGSSRQRLGLDPPRRSVLFYSDREGRDLVAKVQIGRADPTGTSVYASDGDRLQVIPRGVAEALDVDADSLRQRAPIRFTAAQITGVELKKDGKSLRLEGRGDRWMLLGQRGWVRADPPRAYGLAGALAALRVRRFLGPKAEDPGTEDPGTGLHETEVLVRSGSEHVGLRFGEDCPALSGPPGIRIAWASGPRWFRGCVDRRDVVDILGPIQSEDYWDRALSRVRGADLERLVVDEGGHSLEISRDGSSWVWNRGEQRGLADGDAIDEALGRLAGLRGDFEWMSTEQLGHVGVGKGLVLRLVTATGSSQVLRFGVVGRSRVPVQRDSEPGVLWLPSSAAQVAGSDPLGWRSREVLRVPSHELRRVVVVRGAEREVVERLGGKWTVSEPVKIDADLPLMAKLLERIDPLRALSFVHRRGRVVETVNIEIAAGPEAAAETPPGAPHRLTFWKTADQRCFGRLARGPIFEAQVDDCRVLLLPKARRTLFWVDGARLTQIELRGPKGRLSLRKHEGSWGVQTAGGSSPADLAMVGDLVRWLVALRADDVVGYRSAAPSALWSVELGHRGEEARQSCRFDRGGLAECGAGVVYRIDVALLKRLQSAWPEG